MRHRLTAAVVVHAVVDLLPVAGFPTSCSHLHSFVVRAPSDVGVPTVVNDFFLKSSAAVGS